MATIVNDTFTDTNGTAITSHTGEVGATWAAHSINETTAEIQSNRAQPATSGGSDACYYASGTPGSADYSVTGDFVFGTWSASHYFYICGRLSTSAADGYLFGYDPSADRFRLAKCVGSATRTTVASVDGGTPATSGTYRLTITFSGTSVVCRAQRLSDNFYLNSSGTWASPAADCISTTDSSISATGRGGWFIKGTTNVTSLDSFTVDGTANGSTLPLKLQLLMGA